MTIDLGKLTLVDPRKAWSHEAAEFTPWLAQPENLELLGNELGLELELKGTEVQVGPYSADVLASDTANDRNVVIENQLEKTNHDHLGKVLTYGAVLDAAVVVWIAKEFTDEHRKTLDWLNDHTDEHLEFFGVCLELWKVDDSLPACRFNVISRPADLLKKARVGTKEELTDTKKLQLEFWTELRDRLKATNIFPSLQTPAPRHWYSLAIGRSKFTISAVANTNENRIGVRLYLKHQIADAALKQLETKKDQIDNEIGTTLTWNPHPEKRDKIISVDRTADLNKRDEWPDYLEWMTTTIVAFRKAFRHRIKQLDLSGSPSEDDLEE